ncbi:hypothetical protein RO3G_02554 [Rhizopus delemar RA 99-880]|uniref:Septum-promoting GTP-binding protein 1 n=1 Tax=Rhizopus delemar (strain RA 99-880 / ATCC MYA-4621 / FGSC 9543 / NRRL 43880) TaxID=246409 RepID=I1BNS0_RHIO9|nr:hypothetical protein RO3G_02554 [Rhizopus delemar RA 99-880]|eukprot:EIE77850.1 hypothetical protein RO3G_02554 [Rhizopus delemar RA 99-880]
MNSSEPIQTSSPSTEAVNHSTNNNVILKIGIVGDAQIGKTSLMIKYAEGAYDPEYVQTLGVNFMEKSISIRQTEITFSIWDLGGQKQFASMLPFVCNDAVAILFTFDLSKLSSLNNLREWHRQVRGITMTAVPLLVGTKYDEFVDLSFEHQQEMTRQRTHL